MNRVVTIAAVMLCSLTAAAQTTDGIQNWIAAPNWAAPPVDPAERTDPSGREALAGGRQALVGGPMALPFIALPPCRLVDTRGNAPLTGGFLPAATVRSYTLAGVCNVPANAQAISLNATVVNPTGPGFLTLYPQGGTFPPVSTLNYLGNDVIVNAAVVPLSATGGISMALGVSGGDVILDTNGYYAPTTSVNTLNALSGDVTLAAGANISVMNLGNTLTISAVGGGGGSPSGPAGGSLAGTYPNPGIAAGAVGTTQLATGAVTDANVAGGISYSKLAGGNINLNWSTVSSGNIYKGGLLFLHENGNGTFVGLMAGNFTMTGCCNTAFGNAVLTSNTSGNSNTAVGDSALGSNTTGYYNTAIGAATLYRNIGGRLNTGTGYNVLYNNSSGEANTATGFDTLFKNTTGSSNTATGGDSLYLNSTGNENTATGESALGLNTIGSGNTADGVIALYNNDSGNYNTAAGWKAGALARGGTGYTGGGINFVPIVTGSSNAFFGALSGATSDVSNCTAIGFSAYCDAGDQVRLGGPSVTSIGGVVGWSALSDLRAKKDVRDLGLGLDFIMALRPVEYRLKNGNDRVDLGLIAQDVEALVGEGYNVVDVGGDADRTLSLRYAELIAPLIKAVQEQQAQIQAQKAEIDRLKESVLERERLKATP